MIDNTALRRAVVSGLTNYLNVPIIRSNQNVTPPKYPYLSYTVTTVLNANGGTWGEYPDGVDRIPATQTWSITAQSTSEAESVELAIKAQEWLSHIGRTYLNDNDVIVQSVTNITNRDNMISIDYEYRNGFDVVFYFLSEVGNPAEEIIENITLKGGIENV